MRKSVVFIVVSIFFLMASQNVWSADLIEVDSKISHVTVYPEWAYVTRNAKLSIPKGISKLTFKGLPAWIDPESINVKITPSEKSKILNVITKAVYLRQISEKEVREAQKKVIKMRDRIEDIDTELNALDEEKEYLSKLMNWKLDKIPHESAARKVDIGELKDVESFIGNAILANMKKKNELDRKIRDIYPELEVLEKEWAEVQSRVNLEQKEIFIDIESENSGEYEIFVSYLISGASWYPKYDARTGIDIKKVDIASYAVVQQSTGENWYDASFTLSTIKPYLIRKRPELNPWYVNESNTDQINQTSFDRSYNEEYNTGLKRIQEKQKKSMERDLISQQAYDEYQDNIIQARAVVKQAEERGTTVEFQIKGSYSIKTDGKSVKLPIGKTTLKAKRKYSAIPVVSKSTYVVSTMRNDSTFPFLPGVVEVYKAGNFIGKSNINFVAGQEKFELYMGLEERIKVSRKLDTKKSSPSFFGNKTNLKVGYNIKVQNYLEDKAIVSISDQIPVSQSDQIKVKLSTMEPKTEKLNKGIMTWDVELDPMEKKTLYFEFEIEYPENIYLDNAMELEKQLKSLY